MPQTRRRRGPAAAEAPTRNPQRDDEADSPSADAGDPPRGRRSPYAISSFALLALSDLARFDAAAMPTVEAMRKELARFPFGHPEFSKERYTAGIIVHLHPMLEIRERLAEELGPKASPKKRRSTLERLAQLLHESVEIVDALPRHDQWALWRSFAAACRREADPDALRGGAGAQRVISELFEVQTRHADWSLILPRHFLKVWVSAVLAVASEIGVDRGRPRVPRSVEETVEALGCVWNAATLRLPTNGNKRGSFGDFAQTFTPMMIKGTTTPQIATATRRLVARLQKEPGYVAVDPLTGD